jgi:hypothetical protein
MLVDEARGTSGRAAWRAAIVLGGLAVVAFGIRALTTERSAGDTSSSNEVVEAKVRDAGSEREPERAGFGVGEALYLNGDGNYGRVLEIAHSPGKVLTETRERDPSTLFEDRYDAQYGVSIKPLLIASLHSVDDFLLAGLGRFGAIVVEQWHLAPIEGGYHSSRPWAETPIGIQAPYSLTSFSITGSFVPARERGGWPVAERSVIYRGSILTDVEFLVGDPEGRFALAGSAADEVLVRFDLQNPDVATVLYTAVQIPLLSGPARVEVAQHDTLGRGYFLYSGDHSRSAVLWDLDNDAVFDLVEQYDGTPSDQDWYQELKPIE